MRIGFIVPYFGKLPSYFQTFLDTCRTNPGVDWLIFTDDTTAYDYPSNVHVVEMSFAGCRQLVQEHFDFPITLHTPHKLCDYKPAYGFIFQDYLRGYDWWGHCDIDMVLGSLGDFLTDDLLARYDKIYTMGHMTLYRNTPENDRVFMSDWQDRPRYREVFTTERGCIFDEWVPGSINDIYMEKGLPMYTACECADLDAYHTTFQRIYYDLEEKRFKLDGISNSIFRWEGGHLWQIYEENGGLARREYAYLHLFKRKMSDSRRSNRKPGDPFYIIPNRYVDGDRDPQKLLRSCEKWRRLNYQYLRVKKNSLMDRLKSGNWENVAFFKEIKKRLN